MAQKITVSDDGLTVCGPRWPGRCVAVALSDIVEVASEKMDKVTYEELFLIIRDHDRAAVVLGELDDGFDEAEAALRLRLPDFPADWRAAAEGRDARRRTVVWKSGE